MNLSKLRAAVDAAAADDPEVAKRVLVVYLAPGELGGLFVYRVGVGAHMVGAEPDEDFQDSMMRAVEKLWPESTPKLRSWLRVAVHAIARSPLARKMMGGNNGLDGEKT